MLFIFVVLLLFADYVYVNLFLSNNVIILFVIVGNLQSRIFRTVGKDWCKCESKKFLSISRCSWIDCYEKSKGKNCLIRRDQWVCIQSLIFIICIFSLILLIILHIDYYYIITTHNHQINVININWVVFSNTDIFFFYDLILYFLN